MVMVEHQTPDIIGVERILFDLKYPCVLGTNGKPRKRVVILPAGEKAGIVSGTRLDVFSQLGIPAEHIDLFVCISVGAYNGLAYRAGQTSRIGPMYEEYADLPAYTWNRVRRFLPRLAEIFDLETARKCKAEMLYTFTDYFGREPDFFSPQSDEETFAALEATSSVLPFALGRKINGRRRFDGAFFHPCPLREIIRKIRKMWGSDTEIDILVLWNRPRPEFLPLLDPITYWLGVNFGLFPFSPWLAMGANRIDGRVTRSVKMVCKRLQQPKMHVCMWFPRHYIPPVTLGAKRKLRALGDAVRAETEGYFRSIQSPVWL